MNRQDEIRKRCIELRKRGLTYRQIGRELKITRDMVAGHLYRARKQALEKGLTERKVVG